MPDDGHRVRHTEAVEHDHHAPQFGVERRHPVTPDRLVFRQKVVGRTTDMSGALKGQHQ